MNGMHMMITIDGPAGAGKSTVARQLAGRLGVDFLDTGAMYRGITAAALDQRINPADAAAMQRLLMRITMTFDFSHDPPRLIVNGRVLDHRLRDADVTEAVSAVASNSAVRKQLVALQQQIGREHPRLVTEGRDQGSVVFPNATIKFYLDACARVRARRRAEQLQEAGQAADEDRIYESIVARDQRDSTRSDGPLICPEDARRIDTSDMTLQQVVDRLTDECHAAMEERA